MRVFISHSDDDVEIASLLISLLRNALNLSREDIRCSGVDGYRLPVGAQVDETLRREVNDAPVFVGLITPSALTSVYVLFELGARWGAEKRMLPLLASGATPDLLVGPLKSINALDSSNASQVIQFVEDAADALGVDAGSASAYVQVVNKLVEASGAAPPVAAPSLGHQGPDESDQAIAQPTFTPEGPALSEQAQRLLVEASKDNAGLIRKVPSAGGVHIFTKTKSFAKPGDPRLEALWQGALEELINHDLVRDRSGRDLRFEMTHKGFLVADQLRASRGTE